MKNNKQIFSWALYDWGNSAFATVVMAGFFPVFFRDYWAVGLDSTRVTSLLGTANSLSSVVIVVLAPILGAIADRGGAKKKFLFLFAYLGVLMAGSLFWVEQGAWAPAIALFAAGSIGFMGANIFYDALLVNVAPPGRLDRVSAMGYALGYLGGGFMFAFCVLMLMHPAWFALPDKDAAVRVAFLLVALWWGVFSLPVLLFVKEPEPASARAGLAVVVAAIGQLKATFHEVRKLRFVFLFLLAYWLYIDGVDTVVRMAVDYGKSIGFDTNDVVLALLITQFVGFPAALFFGFLGERIGARVGILIGIAVYIMVVIWSFMMSATWEFYGIAVTIGLVQGGVQSLSRSLYASIIPTDKVAEFFGFYNMLGKFAAVLGPAMMALVTFYSDSARLGILSLLVLFIGGGLLLFFVDVTAARAGRDGPQAAVVE